MDPIHPFVSLVLKQQRPPPCGGGRCVVIQCWLASDNQGEDTVAIAGAFALGFDLDWPHAVLFAWHTHDRGDVFECGENPNGGGNIGCALVVHQDDAWDFADFPGFLIDQGNGFDHPVG